MRCPEGSSGPSGTPSTRCRYLWGRGTRSQAEPHSGWGHSRGVPLTLRTQQVQPFWGPTVPLVLEVRGAPSQDHALPCGLCSLRQVELNCRTCHNLGRECGGQSRGDSFLFESWSTGPHLPRERRPHPGRPCHLGSSEGHRLRGERAEQTQAVPTLPSPHGGAPGGALQGVPVGLHYNVPTVSYS